MASCCRNHASKKLCPDAAARDLLMSMSMEKCVEYAFCLQASGSQQFLFTLLR